MKNKLVYSLLLMLFPFVFYACKKQNDPSIPPPYYPPNDTTLHTAASIQVILDVPNASPVFNAWGKLIAMKTDSSYITTHGDTVHTGGQYGFAFFTDSSTAANLDAGIVTINGVSINNPSQINYNGSTNSLDNGCNWVVSGSATVPAMSFNYTGGFPAITTGFPYKVVRGNGLSLTFNSTTVANADSVYVIISSKDLSSNPVHFVKCFSAKAGDILISGSDINYLPLNSTGGAFLTLIPFKYTGQPFADKKYMFVKQAEISHNISLQ